MAGNAVSLILYQSMPVHQSIAAKLTAIVDWTSGIRLNYVIGG